jgi:hypothetical protein
MPEQQLRTVKGLTAALKEIAVAQVVEPEQQLKVVLVQTAEDVKSEGKGLRAFLQRALPLLQQSAAGPITAPVGSHTIAADVVRKHVYSLVHVARILATVHNMLLDAE